MYIEYTAKRQIKPDHTEGGLYWLDVKLTRCKYEPQPETHTTIALNGKAKTLFHRLDQTYDIATAYTDDLDQIAELHEFLASVCGGESFKVDLMGDGAGLLQTAMLHPVVYNVERYGTTDYLHFSFKVRLV
ncbi:hypothetical protein HCH_04544 [Hahella chejuensis KCTC 2396]|uniref:Uncharacterized protein n=1 Tax=Hahella chejuensis (strain KCTC 2396) TaxID=349521 RepID=Q2SDN0_HAHCH|nr:hypothetical protein [Hahella chejuensis]ABC31244.1 hypothetical protein HCH_04544 [Hahella chejuensis KCTC 2396]